MHESSDDYALEEFRVRRSQSLLLWSETTGHILTHVKNLFIFGLAVDSN